MQQSTVCITKYRDDIDKLWRFRLDQKLDCLNKDVDKVKHSQACMTERMDHLENANSAILSRIEQMEQVAIPELNRNIQRVLEQCRKFDTANASKHFDTSLNVKQHVFGCRDGTRGQGQNDAQLPVARSSNDIQHPDTQLLNTQQLGSPLPPENAPCGTALLAIDDQDLTESCVPLAETPTALQKAIHLPQADPDEDDELRPTMSTQVPLAPIEKAEEIQHAPSTEMPLGVQKLSRNKIDAQMPCEQPTQLIPPREQLERRAHRARSRTNRVPRFQQGGMRMEQYIGNVDLLSARLTVEEQGKLIIEFIKGLDSRSLKRKMVDALAANDNTRVLRNIDGTVKSIAYVWEEARCVMEAQGLVTALP